MLHGLCIGPDMQNKGTDRGLVQNQHMDASTVVGRRILHDLEIRQLRENFKSLFQLHKNSRQDELKIYVIHMYVIQETIANNYERVFK